MASDPHLTEATRNVVRSAYDLYSAGKVDEATAFLAEDIDFALVAPRHLLRFAGRHVGRENVRAAFREIAETFEFLSYQPQLIIADGENASVYVRCTYRHHASGNGATLEFCDVLRVKNGQIVWLREFMDTATLGLALTGALADVA